MTLALYGKSRRRQGALITAALLAVIIATVGALGAITSAFAHTATITNDCNSFTVSLAAFDDKQSGNGGKNEVLIEWKVDGGSTQSQKVSFTGKSHTFTQPISPYSSVQVRARWESSWTRDGHSGDTGWVTKNRPTNCDRTIRIVKVTKGSNAPSTWSFSGTITNASPKTWTITNSTSNSRIDVTVPKNQSHTVTEDTPGAGWTLVGYHVTDKDRCPGKENSYTDTKAEVKSGDKDVTVCILNEYKSGNIQVHKYLPKENPPANAPWQNQGNGQGQWTFSVYTSLADAQNGTNPIATFNQLGSNSPDLPQTDLWIKETGMPSGYQFFAWFVPDGDNNSGNDKCNTKPLDGTGLNTSTILHIPASYWSTKGNRTGLFHICAYNKPKPTKTIKICKVVVGNGDGIVRSGTFNFDVRYANGGSTIHNGLPGGGITASEPYHDTNGAGGAEVCKDVQVPATATIEIVEWGSRPTGWNGDASGYPKYSINGGNPASGETTVPINMANQTSPTVTFFNKEATTTIKICKVVEDNGDGYTRPAGTFVLTVNASSQTTYHAIDAAEGGGPACKDVTVPANATIITVGEAADRPTDWNGDAQGYPKVSGPDESGTYTVTNKEKVVKYVTFSKYICDTFRDVPRNEGPGGQDDTGKPVYPGGLNSLLGPKGPSNDNDPVTPSNDNRGASCRLATESWTFNLWTEDRSNGFGGTQLQTVTVTGSQTVQLNDAVIAQLQDGKKVYVEEVYQTGYAFGALKCYTDHLNDDNWEWLFPSVLAEQGTVHCIAYNVPVKTILIEKVWVGDSSITSKDHPIFTLDGFPFATACTGPQLMGPVGNPPFVYGYWSCTVPVGWNGQVTEEPATGWQQCQVGNGNGNGALSAQTAAYASFTNCKLGKIIVHKVYPEGTPTDFATFSGSITGYPSGSPVYSWGPLTVNGSYTIENVAPGPYDVSETLPSGYELVGIASSTNTEYAGAAIACGARTFLVADVPGTPDITVYPGETLHVWVCNRPLGTVVIVKYENVPPATTQTWQFTGTVPTLPQSLSTTGTTNSVGTASTTILNVPVGSYTVAETQGRGQCQTGATSNDWETRGLFQVGGSLPTAGDVNSAAIIGNGSLNVPVQAGKTTYVVFGNIGCGSVLSAANLVVNKYSDPFANFTGTTPLANWTITITGTAGTATGFTASQDTSGAGQALFLGIPDGTYTVCETLQSGWANVGSKYNTVTQAGVCRTGVTVNLNQTATVDFYNQPRVTIRVHKTLNNVGNISNGQGWQFTLEGCGVGPLTGTTGADGVVEFPDLPPAIRCSYTVTETRQPGWTPQFVSQTAQPVAGGQVVTLEFLNIKDFDRPCTDQNDPRCPPPPPPSTPTPTPTTPTTTTSTPTPTATPTNTPTPTPTNTPVTQVAGERTPGPGASPTPLAPATGYGFGGAQGGMSLLLVLAGLISLSLGLGFIALSRRTNR